MNSSSATLPRQSKPRVTAYLENSGKIVDGVSEAVNPAEPVKRFELVACKCKCRFCPDCAKRLGLVLRERLKSVLATFQSVQMWTLTIDPTLFGDEEEAYRYVRNKRAISELVRALKKAGHLKTERYFVVAEFHKSGWVHFHLLVEASFIPFELVCEIWNRNRPADLAPPDGKRPGFGSVRFSVGKGSRKGEFVNFHHAANYVVKYLTKSPSDGWPDWVLKFDGQVHRFQTSRGFWGEPAKSKQEIKGALPSLIACPSDCFCDTCRGDVEPLKRRRTIGERINDCARGEAAIIEITETPTESGVEVVHRWVGKSLLPYVMALEQLNRDPELSGLRVSISASEAQYLRGDACGDYYSHGVDDKAGTSRATQKDFGSWLLQEGEAGW